MNPVVKNFGWLGVLSSLLLCSLPAAGETSVSGFIASEVRWFPQTSSFDAQLSGAEPSPILSPKLRYRSEGNVSPFTRLTGRNSDRSHVGIREAYISTRSGDWDFLMGANKVFWGVAESRHSVDIINQITLSEDTEEKDKLGQPMLNVGVQKGWGR